MVRAALMGRISRMCVYWSLCRAISNNDLSGPHQIAREVAPRVPKTVSDAKLEIDSRFEALCTMYLPNWFVLRFEPSRQPVRPSRPVERQRGLLWTHRWPGGVDS